MNKQSEPTDDYVLIEELPSVPKVSLGANSSMHSLSTLSSSTGELQNTETNRLMIANQRILQQEKKVLDAVSQWCGAKGRFVLRKKGSVRCCCSVLETNSA